MICKKCERENKIPEFFGISFIPSDNFLDRPIQIWECNNGHKTRVKEEIVIKREEIND